LENDGEDRLRKEVLQGIKEKKYPT